MSETMTELSLTLAERHTADFEMIGNGGFAPLTGFQGSADWERVCAEMRTADGDYWPIPITLATDLECEVGDVVELSSDEGKPLGRLTVEEIWERDVKREAEQVYGTTDEAHPGVAAIYEEGNRLHRRPDRGRRAARPRGGLHAPLQDAGRAQSRLRGARLEEDRRLPDPQPDPPRPRVPDQGRAGDLRRALHPPADRQDQGRRHPRRRADALLRGADGELLPATTGWCSASSRRRCTTPARARRSCTRSSAATTAPPTSSSAATTPAPATTTAPTTRRRSSTRSTSTSSGSSR